MHSTYRASGIIDDLEEYGDEATGYEYSANDANLPQSTFHQEGKIEPLSPEELSEARAALTTGECKDAFGSTGTGPKLTCHFRNLYFDARRKAWIVHYLKSENSTVPLQDDLKEGLTVASDNPDIVVAVHFIGHDSLVEFWSQVKDAEEVEGLTLPFHGEYHFNVGHALWDGLFPAFVSLVQWNLSSLPFSPMLDMNMMHEGAVEARYPGQYARMEDIFKTFGGSKLLSVNDFQNKTTGHSSRFKEVILGHGHYSAYFDQNADLELTACRDLGACRIFRDRLYLSYGFTPPSKTNLATAESGRRFRVTFVLDKRIPWEQVDKMIEGVNADASLSKIVQVEKVDWSPDRVNDTRMSFNSANLSRHLEILRHTDIHIASVGTAQMYQALLPDGAVHFALGVPPESADHSRDVQDLRRCPREYWEEYMTEGPPYLQAVYYTKGGNLDLTHFKSVMWSAVDLLQHPDIPHKHSSNLSPIGQVWRAYHWLRRNRGITSETGKLPLRLYSTPIGTYHHFHDLYVCPKEFGQHHTVVDSCLIHELRKSFDQQHPDVGDNGKGFFGLG